MSDEVFHSDAAARVGFPAALEERAKILGGALAEGLRQLARFEGEDGAAEIPY